MKLNVNSSKLARIEFLGHLVTPTGISLTEQRVNILQASAPKTKSKLKSFLGLMTYNAKFIPSVASSVLHPLYQLLRKNSHWQWTVKCQDAFDKAKVLVSQSPVLVHYDVNKPINCDASPHGVEACLMMEWNGQWHIHCVLCQWQNKITPTLNEMHLVLYLG